jgi:hypothetical protein
VTTFFSHVILYKFSTALWTAGPSGRAIQGVGLRPLVCWDCAFASRRWHGRPCLVTVVCCQVGISTSGWSLVQRSPADCGVSECDREASTVGKPWPNWGVVHEKNNLIIFLKLDNSLSHFGINLFVIIKLTLIHEPVYFQITGTFTTLGTILIQYMSLKVCNKWNYAAVLHK